MPKSAKPARSRAPAIKVRMPVNVNDGSGTPKPQLRNLNQKQRAELEDSTNREMQERIAGMSSTLKLLCKRRL